MQNLTLCCVLLIILAIIIGYDHHNNVNGQQYNIVDPNNPVIQTDLGPVRGSKYTIVNPLNRYNVQNPNLQIVQFIGIPYGAPTSGSNRFKAPRFASQWGPQEKDCTGSNRVMCPQQYQRFQYQTSGNENIRMDEDCLHLNIYVPIDGRTRSMPVVVYIHGGEFRYGGKDFYRPDYLLQAPTSANTPPIIVVTINYRLGVFGFLSTDDYNAPGNNGIRDQALALQWVAENIVRFGGNASAITIMGHDAGAASVSFHLLNTEVNGYFTNAISISGTVFSPWAIQDNPVAQARDFANKFNCGYRTDQIVECLRSQDMRQLLAVTDSSRDWEQNRQPFWFRPVVDRNNSASALLKDFPEQLYRNGYFNRKPLVLVTTTKEGSLDYFLQSGRLPPGNDLELKIAYLIRPYLKYYTREEILSAALSYRYFNRSSRSIQQLSSSNNINSNFGPLSNSYDQYTLNNQINTGNYRPLFTSDSNTMINGYTQFELNDLFSQMLGDFLYTGPIDQTAKLHSEYTKTLLLVFDYLGTKSFGPIQNDVVQQTSIDNYGVTHSNDIFYLMPNLYDPTPLEMYEQQIASTYTSFIANFIINGFPNVNNYPLYFYRESQPDYNVLTKSSSRSIIPVKARNSNDGYRTTYVDFISKFIYRLQDLAVIFPPYFPQQEYKSYQQATWSLVGLSIFLLLIIIIMIIIIVVEKRKKHQEEKYDRGQQVQLKRRFDDPGSPYNSE